MTGPATRSLALSGPDAAIRIGGVVDVRPRGTGVALSRLPAWSRAQITDPALRWTATMASGARVEVETDSTAIELEVQLTRLAFAGVPPLPAGFDLEADDDLVAGQRVDEGRLLVFSQRSAVDFDVVAGGPTSIRFAGLAPGPKRLRVWLPQSASVELLAVRVDGDAAASAPAPSGRRWVHYGSSVSQCVEARRPTGVWPVIAARRAGVDLQNLAIAGQCHLDQFSARTIRDLDADLISLKVGINIVNGDTLRERAFVPAVHGFLDTVRDGHPVAPVMVITPIVCPAVEHAPGPTTVGEDGRCLAVARTPSDAVGSLTLVRIRRLLSEIVEARVGAGDPNLHLLDGLELFGPGDLGDLPDGLHPNSDGYQRIGERFHDRAFTDGGPFA